MNTIGIIGAMPEEVNGIVELISNKEITRLGSRVYYSGKINHSNVVVVFCRWGKVAAASTSTTLIQHFNVSKIIFTGVAGAIAKELNIGDIVIGSNFIQHDLNGSPIIPQFEIPLLNTTEINANHELTQAAINVSKDLVKSKFWHQQISPNLPHHSKISVTSGLIASGDQFISTPKQQSFILEHFPQTLCVEMEGAAVAQVCFENNIPFTVMRVISDKADHSSHVDFPVFIENIAARISKKFIEHLLK